VRENVFSYPTLTVQPCSMVLRFTGGFRNFSTHGLHATLTGRFPQRTGKAWSVLFPKNKAAGKNPAAFHFLKKTYLVVSSFKMARNCLIAGDSTLLFL